MTVFNVQQMLGLPTGLRAQAGTVFQGAQEGVAQERLIGGHQRVPLGRRDGGQAVQDVKRHAIPR